MKHTKLRTEGELARELTCDELGTLKNARRQKETQEAIEKEIDRRGCGCCY